jgi:pantoate--beta-alanine ligase
MTAGPTEGVKPARQALSNSELAAALAKVRAAGASVGLVPTMGALHEGHLSLIRQARRENDFVVVSVFVNPTQFGPQEDFSRYPRDLARDADLSFEAGADLVFAPTGDEMYPRGFSTWVDVEGLTDGLCGGSRPGHFRGVCTVVTKLLCLCRPERAYFGQKDAQQLAVIRRMARDLNLGVEIVPCPIVREADGLAMSSRNVYLTTEQRVQAVVLSRSLRAAEALVEGGERDAATVEAAVRAVLAEAPLGEIDYVALVDAQDLTPMDTLCGEVLLALAVRFGKARLIDNTILRV